MAKPLHMSMEDFEWRFRRIAGRLDWVYDEIDFRTIQSGTARAILQYSLKEGVDAFVPEASFVPELI
jgi:hypothetical protein